MCRSHFVYLSIGDIPVHKYVQEVFLHMYMYMCRNLSTHVCTHLYVQEEFLHIYMCRRCSYTCIRVSSGPYTCICAVSIPEHIYWQEGFLHMMCRKFSCPMYMYICEGSIPAHMYSGSIPAHLYVQAVFLHMYMVFLNIVIGRKNSCT